MPLFALCGRIDSVVYGRALICAALDDAHPRKDGRCYLEQITFVKDHLGMIAAMRWMRPQYCSKPDRSPATHSKVAFTRLLSGISRTKNG